MRSWHRKYLERLADVYLERYDAFGYEIAKDWYNNFLTPELRKLVRPIIQEKVEQQKRSR